MFRKKIIGLKCSNEVGCQKCNDISEKLKYIHEKHTVFYKLDFIISDKIIYALSSYYTIENDIDLNETDKKKKERYGECCINNQKFMETFFVIKDSMGRNKERLKACFIGIMEYNIQVVKYFNHCCPRCLKIINFDIYQEIDGKFTVKGRPPTIKAKRDTYCFEKIIIYVNNFLNDQRRYYQDAVNICFEKIVNTIMCFQGSDNPSEYNINDIISVNDESANYNGLRKINYSSKLLQSDNDKKAYRRKNTVNAHKEVNHHTKSSPDINVYTMEIIKYFEIFFHGLNNEQGTSEYHYYNLMFKEKRKFLKEYLYGFIDKINLPDEFKNEINKIFELCKLRTEKHNQIFLPKNITKTKQLEDVFMQISAVYKEINFLLNPIIGRNKNKNFRNIIQAEKEYFFSTIIYSKETSCKNKLDCQIFNQDSEFLYCLNAQNVFKSIHVHLKKSLLERITEKGYNLLLTENPIIKYNDFKCGLKNGLNDVENRKRPYKIK